LQPVIYTCFSVIGTFSVRAVTEKELPDSMLFQRTTFKIHMWTLLSFLFQAIVWDESLAGPVGLVAKYSLLRENEVSKMFPLRAGHLPPANEQNIIFITRPLLHLMDLVADNIHG
jgi:hypothetical protein